MGTDLVGRFVVELPHRFEPLFALHQRRASAGLMQALAALFGLPSGSPVRLQVRFVEVGRLVEVAGEFPCTPTELEVQGLLIGVMEALYVVCFDLGHTVNQQQSREVN